MLKPMSWLGQIRPHRRDESWFCRKFGIGTIKKDALVDHLCTCTTHSGSKKTHDWSVDQFADLFRTTHKVKTQEVIKSRVQHCGDIELVGYLANVVGPVPLVLDLHIVHDRFGSSSNPNLNGKLHWPNDMDTSLNETVTDKIRKYRTDYNNNPPNVISFMPVIVSTPVKVIIDDIYCKKWQFKWHPFYDNIIDCNKWHFNRFLNPYLFDCNTWHFNRFLNQCLSRIPEWNQRGISCKYHLSNPLTQSEWYLFWSSSSVTLKMLKRHSDGQELGELSSTVRNMSWDFWSIVFVFWKR